MPYRLQKCSSSELDELVGISRKTFVDAFEKFNDPSDFKAYIAFAFNRKKILSELINDNSAFYFVYQRESLVGYFKLNSGGAQTDLKLEESIELERIYVLEEFQGKKAGQWMLDQAIDLAITDQKKFLWLGVWQKNKRAIRFYEKHGFVKFGTHPYYIGQDKQTDWLMKFEFN